MPWVNIVQIMNIHKFTRNWDCTQVDYWVGTPLHIPNQSRGYHGILSQWWNHYKKSNAKWLLVSELNVVKPYFQDVYPGDTFHTLELYAEPSAVDYRISLCDRNLPAVVANVDLVVCQATLEHVHDPWSAILNMSSILNSGGLLTIHTHVPPFHYHPYPRDYLRFFPDWFIDVQVHLPNLELLELCDNGGHIFSAYRKL